MSESFISKQRFFDNKKYPRGFSRHGDFTIKEAQLLEKYGHAFSELDSGKRQPVTDEEQRFVDVCHGNQLPATDKEKVWVKYMGCINKPKRFHTLSGGKPQLDPGEDFSDIDD
ncbi:DUF413 domain-containing protein [Candidatus Schmidhempelia bombi]|jgi:uncharacterized protein|uniref:Macrodomain Ori protein n=1 Tax=Candidatus Schmidhempelia bombi str. Bimp TaxID=1387197 RepID=A0AB94IEZ5_9GAMM|nr:DUF413 domain-containing protein [Candidatus Schmidhempelia bombi]TEA28083.1 DUF413 domain-containing protein [Candidatus Schmidhempelia bombi str. Bimp]